MSLASEKRYYTPEDLLKLPDGDHLELVDGQLVEREPGGWSSYIGGRLLWLIGDHVDSHCLGWVFSSTCGYQCFADAPNQVRRSSASFIGLGRLPAEEIPQGHVRIPPDLVVEVLSPQSLAYASNRKVEDFLRAGVRLVWVVNPESRIVLVYRTDGSIYGLREED